MNPEWLPLSAAFLIGLFGSGHCVAMCGGIVGALSLPSHAPGARENLFHPLAYHGGRLTSYAIAGALVGLLGSASIPWLDPALAARVANWVSAVFLVLLGFYLAGATTVLGFLERATGKLWRRIEPFGRRFLPIRHTGHAWAAGLVWGWLPCGMVYAVLSLSLGAGGALPGAARMLAFGLGTVPALLLAAQASRRLALFPAGSRWRRLAGGLIVLAGVLMAWQPDWLFGPAGGVHHH
jgi:hypothetical protein